MSRKGCSPDNAACEGFFGRLKTELFYPRQWRATTIEQFIQILDSYIRWYNEKRIKDIRQTNPLCCGASSKDALEL